MQLKASVDVARRFADDVVGAGDLVVVEVADAAREREAGAARRRRHRRRVGRRHLQLGAVTAGLAVWRCSGPRRDPSRRRRCDTRPGCPWRRSPGARLMSCGKRWRSSLCFGAIDSELSTMNKMSTLFLTDWSTRTLVSCVTVVFGDSTGGDRQANNGMSPTGAMSRTSFQVRERIRNPPRTAHLMMSVRKVASQQAAGRTSSL